MSNIPGLNKEESEWVCSFYEACANHKNFTDSAPTKRAADYVFKDMKERGY